MTTVIETSRSLADTGGANDGSEAARYYHADPSWYDEAAVQTKPLCYGIKPLTFRSIADMKEDCFRPLLLKECEGFEDA